MSAFIVEAEVIKAVALRISTPHCGRPDVKVAERVANTLNEQNHASVNYRYNEDYDVETLTISNRELLKLSAVSLASVVSAAACINYQSCDTKDYEDTEAGKLLHTFLRESAHKLAMEAGANNWGTL